jgi:hypothetical protein
MEGTVKKESLKTMQNIIIKKIDLCRDFAADIYLSEAQNPI